MLRYTKCPEFSGVRSYLHLPYRIRHVSSHRAFFITCNIYINKTFKKTFMRIKGDPKVLVSSVSHNA